MKGRKFSISVETTQETDKTLDVVKYVSDQFPNVYEMEIRHALVWYVREKRSLRQCPKISTYRILKSCALQHWRRILYERIREEQQHHSSK